MHKNLMIGEYIKGFQILFHPYPLNEVTTITYNGIKKNIAHIIIKQYIPILPIVKCLGLGPFASIIVIYHNYDFSSRFLK